MGDPPQIRRASEQHAAGIAEVHVRAWRAAYRGLIGDELLDRLSVEDRERSFREQLLRPPDGLLAHVALAAGSRVHGFCVAVAPSRDADAADDVAEIAAIYVDPDRWRGGIGSALLTATFAELRERSFREVTLWAFAANDQARRFYQRFGFQPDGQTATHAASGRPTVRLRADLR